MNWKLEIYTILINIIVITGTGTAIGYFFNKRLEKIKKDTAIYLMEYQTLNLKRTEAIEDIYSTLEKAIRYMSDSISQFQNVNDSIQLDRVNEAQKFAQNFKETYSAKKIYLTPNLADKLVDIDKKMMTNWSEFIRSNPKLNGNTNKDFKRWDKAWNAFATQDIPIVFKELETEFRVHLGTL